MCFRPILYVYCSVLSMVKINGKVRKVRKRIAVCATSTAPLRELTCHMGSHSITCHPAEVTVVVVVVVL